MNRCHICLSVAIFCCSLVAIVTAVKKVIPAECKATNPSDRINCGFPGISANACNSRDCCFDDSLPGYNFCFFKPGQCNLSDRRNCGFSGITASECAEKHCCFDRSQRGVAFCFHSASTGDSDDSDTKTTTTPATPDDGEGGEPDDSDEPSYEPVNDEGEYHGLGEQKLDGSNSQCDTIDNSTRVACSNSDSLTAAECKQHDCCYDNSANMTIHCYMKTADALMYILTQKLSELSKLTEQRKHSVAKDSVAKESIAKDLVAKDSSKDNDNTENTVTTVGKEIHKNMTCHVAVSAARRCGEDDADADACRNKYNCCWTTSTKIVFNCYNKEPAS